MMPLFSLLLMPVLVGQSVKPAEPHTVTRPLTANELASSASRLERSLVPGIVGRPRLQPQQAFSVGPAPNSFWLEPVSYEANNAETGNTSPRCGIFLLSEREKAVFVPTLGSGWTEAETCTDLEGVGFLQSDSAMPRVLLLYAASSPNFSTREPIVLDWNAATHRYEGNRQLSLALTHRGGNTSIAGMKRRIRELAASQ